VLLARAWLIGTIEGNFFKSKDKNLTWIRGGGRGAALV
jgi:hypothetical protein